MSTPRTARCEVCVVEDRRVLHHSNEISVMYDLWPSMNRTGRYGTAYLRNHPAQKELRIYPP